jgi:glycosyltransferase involved in cell wall biosynthesis
MKILFIAPTPYFAHRGSHVRIFEQVYNLQKNNFKPLIVTYHIGECPNKYLQTDISIKRIRPWIFWYKKLEAGPSWQKIILDCQLLLLTIKHIRKYNPQVVHAHLHEGILIGWIAKRILFWKKFEFIGDLHGSLTEEMRSHKYLKMNFVHKLFKRLEKWLNARPSKLITSSAANTDSLTSKKVLTLEDGSGSIFNTKKPEKQSMRAELNLPLTKIIIIYTGAFLKNKGIDRLIKEIPEIFNNIPNTHFILAGKGANSTKKEFSINKTDRNITFIEDLNYVDLPKYLYASDIAIDPKNNDTKQGSGKIYNYIAADLPVVCFARKQNKRLLGKNYSFMKKSFSKTIQQILDNPEQFEYTEKLKNTHTWKKKIQTLIDFYHE